ncbi:unnamed protein product [Mytilus edulis]|uniref:FHA domain-containing protein n=1 Tax=Mytilus edulis TaxID=6550 RepID=A0A8S3SQI5_MYTED|nr:unnamed protein product [Mytilus edulis]
MQEDFEHNAWRNNKTVCLEGRDKDCDIIINHTNVSNKHCGIWILDNGEAKITNFSTDYPLKVNNQVITKPGKLNHGDVFTIVDRSFRFEHCKTATCYPDQKSKCKKHCPEITERTKISKEKVKAKSRKRRREKRQRYKETCAQNKLQQELANSITETEIVTEETPVPCKIRKQSNNFYEDLKKDPLFSNMEKACTPSCEAATSFEKAYTQRREATTPSSTVVLSPTNLCKLFWSLFKYIYRMASNAKRPRKACPKCNAVFSDRHARRHLLECNVRFCDTNALTDDATNTDHTSIQCLNPNDISDEEVEFDLGQIRNWNDVLSKSHNNLEIEDIQAYFDANSDNDDFSDLSDHNSDSDICSEENHNKESEFDLKIKQQTYWFCKVLVLWQCIHYISDAAVTLLLNILSAFFKLLSTNSEVCSKIESSFPGNMYQLSKLLKSNMLDFKQYVVCTKCYSLYDFDDCFHVVEGLRFSNTCSYVEFPNHRLPHLRKRCNEPLLKEINNSSSKILVPYKIYCYKSIKSSLSFFVKRNNFEDLCEQWRTRETKEGIMYDIYDGRIWHEFNGIKHEFFTNEGNYGCILNVDWFQPYEHSIYSVGAIYLAFCNLPRIQRFRRENMLLIGVIPDMRVEPKTNTFLKPLVEELKIAWCEGFFMYSYKSPTILKCFKLALICVGCDIPASRKLCGFLGHSATAGCNKCKKKFPGGVGEKNYGGFDRDSWISRDNASHREECCLLKNCTSKGDKEALERNFGTRYSVLLELVYFDPIRMTALDPMHNLFLGTAKHMISVWKTKKLLCDDDFRTIQERLEPFQCPSDVGRLPKKFSSSFGSFNADQYKNWTLLFSIYALYDLLPSEHLDCWRKFVLACRRLCSIFITVNNAKVADRLLLEFCKKFEQLYGQDFVTPNMHLHGHLYDCILDFGPVYSFWLFSFERENGILGSYKTNKKNIEVQLMKRFLKESLVREEDMNMDKHFQTVFNDLTNTTRERGTLGVISAQIVPSILELSSQYTSITEGRYDVDTNIFASKFKDDILNDNEIKWLDRLYSTLYHHDEFTVCTSVKVCKELYVNGSLIGSKTSRSHRSSYVLAFWCNEEGAIDTDCTDMTPHPGQIVKIYMHSIIVDGFAHPHYLAKVNWFQQLPDNVRHCYGKPIEVWSSDLYVRDGPAMFIPIQRIKCRFVHAKVKVGHRNVIVVSPRERFIL